MTSLRLKESDLEWLVRRPSPVVGDTTTLRVNSVVARENPVSAEALTLQVSTGDLPQRTAKIYVFSGVAGVLIEGSDCLFHPKQERGEASGEPLSLCPTIGFRPRHLRATEVTLVDQTDQHDELVFEKSWLLAPNESGVSLSGCIVGFENTFTQDGLALLKLAPLPHARPNKVRSDFFVEGRTRTVRITPDRYPLAILAYRGGRSGRTVALQKLQRRLRTYDPNRDGRFLSNTWGDRSKDARINEAFIRQEIAAAERLGVDVVQVDDGWQQGRTKNSADAGASTQGAWNSFWDRDPAFWSHDSIRFPNGLEPVVELAGASEIGFGLWFAPDSSDSLANWRRDADRLLELHTKTGIDYFKIDAIKTRSTEALINQRRLFDTLLERSHGKVTIDLDVTAEVRPGYFGMPHVGPIFVENRYTDRGTYWPHQTLRNLWMLANYVDPLRLRIEFLNPHRNQEKYGDDPLAPAKYRFDTLFATTMLANPLGWFEVSNLPEDCIREAAPLISRWKQHRSQLHGGVILPVGAAPDGLAWTGFVVLDDEGVRHALLFRELNESEAYTLDLEVLDGLESTRKQVAVVAGIGTAVLQESKLTAKIPEKLGYLWVELKDASPQE